MEQSIMKKFDPQLRIQEVDKFLSLSPSESIYSMEEDQISHEKKKIRNLQTTKGQRTALSAER